MSSRLIRSGDVVDAVPIFWRQIGEPSLQPRAPDARPEARSAELDRQWEGRVQAAFQQGQAAAEAAANQRAAQRLEPALASLAAIIQELTSLRKRFRLEAEQDTVKLAIAIGQRVLHRELATDPEAILGLVIAAFQRLNTRETHRLRVAPSDAAVIEQNRARLDLPPALAIAADNSLAPGSAVFETERGELDASVDTQLAEIQRGFADIIRRRSH